MKRDKLASILAKVEKFFTIGKKVIECIVMACIGYLLIAHAMLIMKVIACILFVAIAWPLIKALRCYVAARVLLAKLIK